MPNKDIVSYILSIPFIIIFAIIMTGFDLFQRIFFIFFGKGFLSLCSFLVSYLVLKSLKITGLKISYPKLDPNLKTPLLIVSNHQSLMDIAIINCLFRKFRPHFIAKKELAKFMPFASFNLRHEGHIVIDRSKGSDAIDTLAKRGLELSKIGQSVVLFPEGTRAREGSPRKFKSGGFIALTKAMENVTIVPLVINSAWKISYFKLLPVPKNIKINIEVGQFKTKEEVLKNPAEEFIKIEEWIKSRIKNE